MSQMPVTTGKLASETASRPFTYKASQQAGAVAYASTFG
jgi:hypothetical protein